MVRDTTRKVIDRTAVEATERLVNDGSLNEVLRLIRFQLDRFGEVNQS